MVAGIPRRPEGSKTQHRAISNEKGCKLQRGGSRGPWWELVSRLVRQALGSCERQSVSVASVEAVRRGMLEAAARQLNEGLLAPTVHSTSHLVEIWEASHVSRTSEVVLVLIAKPNRESTLAARVERRMRLVRSPQAGRLVARWT